MNRCSICKSINDVRGDGLCGGCYDNRMAGQFGLSYGKYVARYGHGFLRRADAKVDRRRRCPVCGREIHPTAGKRAVFCSASCAAEAERMRDLRYKSSQGRKTCRGCQFYVTGSKRCTNKDGPFYNQSHGTGCGSFAKREADHGED